MRFLKDSFISKNPRQRFWESQYASHRRHRLMPFNLIKYLFDYGERLQVNNILLVDGKNWFWKGIEKYIPNRMNVSDRGQLGFFVFGVLLGSLFQSFEARLWKEKKWDIEPGCQIPLRKPFTVRAYKWLIDLKLKPLLYYVGLFIEDIDLDTNVDLTQISEGRKYRRFLVMQYARKMRYNLRRDSRYDFLEISSAFNKE